MIKNIDTTLCLKVYQMIKVATDVIIVQDVPMKKVMLMV